MPEHFPPRGFVLRCVERPKGAARATGTITRYCRRPTQSAVEKYLRLGLQLGRHVEGIVDS
jgi:hypothetical protein